MSLLLHVFKFSCFLTYGQVYITYWSSFHLATATYPCLLNGFVIQHDITTNSITKLVEQLTKFTLTPKVLSMNDDFHETTAIGATVDPTYDVLTKCVAIAPVATSIIALTNRVHRFWLRDGML